MSDNDELVSQFLAFTGSADVDRAQSYLEMSGGNLETAVGLFMEHTGGAAAGAAPGESMQAEAASPQIRAPDETRTMRLMDHEPMIPGGINPLMGALMQANDDEDLMEQASAFARAVDPRAAVNAAAAAAAAAAAVNAASNNNDEDNDDDDTMQGQSQALGNMFSPPTHLIHKGGGFQGARAVAKDARRWLLVNVQKDSEFSSHALNRDVWRDDLVENLIREGFIFFQTVSEYYCCCVVLWCMINACLTLFTSISLLLFYRWTRPTRAARMRNAIRYTIILMWPLSILERDVSCGARRDGRRNVLLPRRILPKWPWTFVLVIPLRNLPLHRVLTSAKS